MRQLITCMISRGPRQVGRMVGVFKPAGLLNSRICSSHRALHTIGEIHRAASGNRKYLTPHYKIHSIPYDRCKQSRSISQSIYDSYLSPESFPVGSTQTLLNTVHDYTGLPWWASITLTTIALRSVLTLPLMVYSVRNKARVELLQPEIKKLASELSREVAHAKMKLQWSPVHAQMHFRINMKRLVQNLYIRDNCHPMKEFILPWIQIPMWISMSLALRVLSGCISLDGLVSPVLAPGLATGGILWFNNLLLCDATYILPLIVCSTNLLIIEMHALKVDPLKSTKLQKSITYGLRGLTLCMLPIAAHVPSCMALYWSVSSVFGLVQNLLLKLPNVRKSVGIPRTPSDTDTPFTDLWTLVKRKFKMGDK